MIKFFFLIKFIWLQLKNVKAILKNYLNFFLEFKKISILKNIFGTGKLKFKNDDINTFLKKNHRFYKKNIEKTKKDKIILELLLSHHCEPIIFNCLIGKDLEKFYDAECVAIINKNDFLTKKIANSFGIKKFEFLKKDNFFVNIYFFIKALNLIDYDQIEKKLFYLKINGYEIGKSAYEQYLRFFNFDIKKKNRFLLYVCLCKALLAALDSKRIFKKKYKFFILGETQFIPNKMLFHHSLKSKTPVYTWNGTGIQGYIGRIFNKYEDRNSITLQYSNKLSKNFCNIYKKKNVIRPLKKNKCIENIGKEPIWAIQKKKRYISFKNNLEFCKFFKFNFQKKTVLILPHAMSDNLYNNQWNIFDTAYDWFFETLKEINKINNVNWLIKPHPYEYKFPGITAKDIYKKLIKEEKDIFFLPEDIHIKNVYKFIDFVVTGNGSAGFEYPSLGIQTITTSDARYSNFNFTIAPKSKKEYFKLLNNFNKLKKIKKEKEKKAQIFWLSNLNLINNSHETLPKINQHGIFKKNLFFKLISRKNLKPFKRNSFSDDIIFQLKNKNRHSIKTNFLSKHNQKNLFSMKDI